MNIIDKLNELLNGLQGGVARIGPEAGAKVTQFFLERIQEAKRDDLEPLRRELLTLQMLLENRPGFDVNAVGIGQQLIALGRTVKTIPVPADTPNAAQTLEYLAMTLEQQGRTLVGDIDIATAPDARFANAQASVVGPAGADQVEPGNDYAALRGV